MYTITLAPTPLTERWTITATPVSSSQMATDGTLTLNAQGLKCRDKNNDGDKQDTGECGMGQEWNN